MRNRRLKVLLLMHELSRTGAPKVVLDLMESLGSLLDVRIISLRGGAHRKRAEAVGPTCVLDDPQELRRPRKQLARILQHRELRKMVQWKPDIIYVNTVAGLPALRAVPDLDAPVLLHVHELSSYVDEALRDTRELLCGRPSRYVAVSRAVAENLVRSCGIAQERISTIYEFLPAAAFKCENQQEAKKSERFVIGGAGTPLWRKGTTLWLQVAHEVRKLLPPNSFCFRWVGVRDDEESRNFHREARLLGVDRLVEMIPATSDPYTWFSTFDVFAMTSWEDPCPLVVLECMMLRKPVVCFAGSGGAAEEIGDTGVVVQDFCPRAMAGQIAELFVQGGRRLRLGDAARARVEAEFTDVVQVPKLWQEMLCVADGKAPSGGRAVNREAVTG